MSKEIPARLVEESPSSFYLSEAKIHPREIKGYFQRLRIAALVWLLGMFYLFPWLSWSGRQAVLFDLPARRFYVFGLNFWPQDFIFLTLLLAIAALALFFFTTIAGRVWCGYACPQTVWTEVYFMLERWSEGDRMQRIKLDAMPWGWVKLRKRGLKLALFILFSLWTGLTFVGFFSPIRELVPNFFQFRASGWEVFWSLFYATATFGNAGFLREQVCKYMCPYARFQSAMFDRNTLLIAYDPRRGEPRGARKRGAVSSVLQRARGLLDLTKANQLIAQLRGAKVAERKKLEPELLGDCIDCNICVQVCPTGIDIRNGLQYECITCGACVDACNEVMGKLDYPGGLIRYTSLNELDGKPARVLRPRVWVYGSILALLIAVFALGVTHRNAFLAEVLHDRAALYRQTANGIENDYTLKLANKTTEAQEYRLQVLPNQSVELDGDAPMLLRVPAETVLAIPFVLRAEHSPGRTTVRLEIIRIDAKAPEQAPRRTLQTMFFGPK